MAALDPMAGVLGPLIFQFEYLNRQKMSGQAEFQERFEQFLAALPQDRQYALETRNPHYLNTAYLDYLRRKKLALCNRGTGETSRVRERVPAHQIKSREECPVPKRMARCPNTPC